MHPKKSQDVRLTGSDLAPVLDTDLVGGYATFSKQKLLHAGEQGIILQAYDFDDLKMLTLEWSFVWPGNDYLRLIPRNL